jgi:Cytochrome c7 and related cytochrome c/Doubled CXXCH motif (Paired_CXXCH_1)
MRWSLTAVFFFAFAVPSVFAQQNSDCLACHGQQGLADQAGHSVYINGAKQGASVHGSLRCTACHADIKGYPHPAHPAAVNCASCHADEARDLSVSVHAKAAQHPCLACHGDPHAIVPVKDPQSPVYAFNIPKTCGSCHSNPEMARKFGLPNVYSMYMDSIHGFALTKDGLLVAASCSSCHGTHRILSHTNPESHTYRANIPATCGTCHAGPEAAYFDGIHGQLVKAGDLDAPVCTDCHTAHNIASVRAASFQERTSATCGTCHKERYETYLDTFHAQVSALGYVETAHCWNCHRYHDILPPSDPQSSVAPANLVATCRQCHQGATVSFISFHPHADPHDAKSFPALHFAAIFMDLLLLGVFGFFGLHTILWFIRSAFDRRKSGA